MHMRGMAFHRLAVVLHLVEGGRVAITIDNLFALLAARTGNDHFVGVDFNCALVMTTLPVKVTTLPCISRDWVSDSI